MLGKQSYDLNRFPLLTSWQLVTFGRLFNRIARGYNTAITFR